MLVEAEPPDEAGAFDAAADVAAEVAAGGAVLAEEVVTL